MGCRESKSQTPSVPIAAGGQLSEAEANEPIFKQFLKFEQQLPFKATLFKTFVEKVRASEDEDHNVEVAKLVTALKDLRGFEQIATEDSIVRELTTAQEIQSEGGQVSGHNLILLALILCAGGPNEKAEEFYAVLQDGGQESIAAGDKDL